MAAKTINRAGLRTTVGLDHDPTGTRLEPGDKIPDVIPDSELRPLIRDGFVVEQKPGKGKKGDA